MALKSNPNVFMDISIGKEHAGRLVFELFANIVPKTAENFRCLCTGEKGPKLHYKNAIFHRVIKGFMAQGGDITHHNGSGCVSIYGRKGAMKDENFDLDHSERGLLSLANSGPNSSGCQFFITFKATPHLDGKHVVFGKLISGMETLQKIEAIPTYKDDKPVKHSTTTITNCGELAVPKPKKQPVDVVDVDKICTKEKKKQAACEEKKNQLGKEEQHSEESDINSGNTEEDTPATQLENQQQTANTNTEEDTTSTQLEQLEDQQQTANINKKKRWRQQGKTHANKTAKI